MDQAHRGIENNQSPSPLPSTSEQATAWKDKGLNIIYVQDGTCVWSVYIFYHWTILGLYLSCCLLVRPYLLPPNTDHHWVVFVTGNFSSNNIQTYQVWIMDQVQIQPQDGPVSMIKEKTVWPHPES